jgi:hypothetical protein
MDGKVKYKESGDKEVLVKCVIGILYNQIKQTNRTKLDSPSGKVKKGIRKKREEEMAKKGPASFL